MAKRHAHILLLAHEAARQPLWDMSEGSPTGEIDPRTLRLSPALLRRLEAWFNDVGAKVAPRAQGINVVESDEQITDFLVEGFYIAGDLQRELGHQIVVVYFRNSLEPEVIKTEMEDGNAYSSTDTVEGEAKERGRNGSFDVRSIEAPAWQKVLDLEAQKRALGNDIGAIPTGKWNRLMDRLSMAENQAVREADLVDRLRAAVPDITDPIDREFVYQAIAPLVVWHAEDIETVWDDPRVRLTAEELVGAPALYLAENAAGDLEDIYSWDLEDRWEPMSPSGICPASAARPHKSPTCNRPTMPSSYRSTSAGSRRTSPRTRRYCGYSRVTAHRPMGCSRCFTRRRVTPAPTRVSPVVERRCVICQKPASPAVYRSIWTRNVRSTRPRVPV